MFRLARKKSRSLKIRKCCNRARVGSRLMRTNSTTMKALSRSIKPTGTKPQAPTYSEDKVKGQARNFILGAKNVQSCLVRLKTSLPAV